MAKEPLWFRALIRPPATILDYAQLMGIPTSFSRAAEFKPCTIGNGQSGVCCKNCYMGPCRITKDGQVGVCGATLETIAAAQPGARHCRWRSRALRSRPRPGLHAACRRHGEAQGYEVRDEAKLYRVAAKHGIPTKGRQ